MSNRPEVTLRQTVSIPIGPENTMADFASFDGFEPEREHFAILFPAPGKAAPLVRIHSECVTGDVFGSQICDCGAQLEEATLRCTTEGGVIIYLRQEGRGIGFNAKIDAYRLQADGANTYAANLQSGHPADARDYSAAIAILHALGVEQCRLLTNNPAKADAVRQSSIGLVEVVPTAVHLTPHNEKYLRDKARYAGHTIKLPDA